VDPACLIIALGLLGIALPRNDRPISMTPPIRPFALIYIKIIFLIIMSKFGMKNSLSRGLVTRPRFFRTCEAGSSGIRTTEEGRERVLEALCV
jgi:hypothetical protein